ncbi:MAG: hypothetical protein V1681_05810 [Candidatus Neomarinimicrobiota bacterium]
MKKIGINVLIVLSLLVSLSHGTGLGIMIGEPTGFSAKLWKSDKVAYDAGLAWSFGNNNSAIHVHADYLIQNKNWLKIESITLPVYYGLGFRAKVGDEFRLGVRVPFGIDYFFNGNVFDVFFEIVPVLDLLPGTGFGINGAIGVRYNY